MDSVLQSSIDEWLRLDKNENTVAEIKNLVSRGDAKELRSRMSKRIEFGTAGLRGRMEAGWARMNDLIVIQASQGLCAYVLREIPEAKKRGIVIGHDHRHHSKEWAKLVAMVFLNKGFKVYLHCKLVHTPLVPFTVSELHAACGVMITASHNPKEDNGYKVYWENAVQIISPHDTGIAKAIEENLEPVSWDTRIVESSSSCEDVTESMIESYYATLQSLSTSRSLCLQSNLKFVNTSMHGVGHVYAVRAFETFGLPAFLAVEAQQDPDPEFPTVSFPNPEEKGALDLALKTADGIDATYVLAQDPDADRFSAAEKGVDGKWITFTGDQLGAILAARCLETYRETGQPLNKLAMVASTVSSKIVEAMALKEGFKFAETLTGTSFKYIGNKAQDLEKEGYSVLFGYEEAIGFMIGPYIRDKDGISATAVFAELAVKLAYEGSSVSTYLQDLYRKYGHFETANSYFICKDPPTIDRIFARLRAYNQAREANYPSTIAGLKVTSIRDLTVGYDSTNPPTYQPTLPLSSGHMIQFRAQSDLDDTKITLTIRTSGTEPKIKFYLEGSGSDVRNVKTILPKVVAELRDVWMEAEKNELQMP
ncbi:phosphoglucomutase 1 [Fomitiporia mediterranea MF3/22]|uniref:phosphoglucomutase 1 n=1 Tax=Fomitiporia mediterranea (strain MF3/22) TaxID=694068 RepID=UPI00044099E9|nr:phosphoglucomutase 1 [Fomitiporia mediterranea MF3/22]EJD05673.1 phosphoglucomutase 1 [Fomitiporia mediterranea MF3/22]